MPCGQLHKHSIRKRLQETIDMLYKVAKKEDDRQLASQAREILLWMFGYLEKIIENLMKE